MTKKDDLATLAKFNESFLPFANARVSMQNYLSAI
jgi:hypothetical protein